MVPGVKEITGNFEVYVLGDREVLAHAHIPIVDPGLAQVSLEVGGQRVTYAHGPVEPAALQWPGSDGKTQVRFTATPANGEPATVIEQNGPWALLRLLDAAHVDPTDQPDKFHITFKTPSGNAVFGLDAASVRNPFSMAAFRAFRCPAQL